MARVELRKSLAHTVRDVGRLYGILTSQFLVPEIAMLNPTKEQKKGFRRLNLDLRRQIAEERTYMHLSSYEPPLRGRFPAERYKAVLETVDSMADLVAGMVSFKEEKDVSMLNVCIGLYLGGYKTFLASADRKYLTKRKT